MRALLAVLILAASVQATAANEVEPDADVGPPCGVNASGVQICR